jgi:hypothetical protein
LCEVRTDKDLPASGAAKISLILINKKTFIYRERLKKLDSNNSTSLSTNPERIQLNWVDIDKSKTFIYQERLKKLDSNNPNLLSTNPERIQLLKINAVYILTL